MLSRNASRLVITRGGRAGWWWQEWPRRRRSGYPASNWGYREPPGVSPRWDQVFLTVATRPSATGPRSRSRPTKTNHPVPKKSLCKCAASARPRLPVPRLCSAGGHRYAGWRQLDRPATISSPGDPTVTVKARGGMGEEGGKKRPNNRGIRNPILHAQSVVQGLETWELGPGWSLSSFWMGLIYLLFTNGNI